MAFLPASSQDKRMRFFLTRNLSLFQNSVSFDRLEPLALAVSQAKANEL
jgi:hypothetical protein